MPNNLTDAEENRLLDLSLLNTDELALVEVLGDDDTDGTEVAGGSYARQVMTFGAAASGAKALSSTLTFPTMPAVEVQGWEIFDDDGVTRKWWGLFSRQIGTAQNSGDTITITGHGYSNDDKVVIQPGTAPTGLTAATTYYVISATSNTFQLAATLGGSAIAISADATNVVVGKVATIAGGDGFTFGPGSVSLTLQ
jgi:hypothetical protein